jgi:hypothetical protein
MVWLFVTPHSYQVLYLEAITSGVMWAGAGLVATNFVLSIAPNERRQLYSGVSGAFSGLAMMTTMLDNVTNRRKSDKFLNMLFRIVFIKLTNIESYAIG